MSNNFKCVSSLVVFRKMYEGRQSIYAIIAEFAKIIIISQKLTSFELNEMCNLLKNEFGLWIVPAVLKTALKKLDFLKREKNVYTLDRLLSSDNVKEIEEQIEQSKYIVSSIIDEYINYKKEKNKVGCIDEPSTKEEFCKFIIDGNAIEDVDTGIISAFIVERKGRAYFEQACKYIREGLIIYNGLSYNADGELLEKIDTPLTVYLETEMLFHATGLNGTLFKSLFSDFYQVVSEINMATNKQYGKNMISLAYFPETKKEVDNYFGQAENIIENNRQIDRSKPAMDIILKGCNSVADVKQKEIEFWRDIYGMGIKIDEMSFDLSKDYYAKYNLSVDEDFVDSKTEDDKKKAYDVGQMMSKVNYLRRSTNTNIFRLVKAIILTGSRKTLCLSDKNTQQQNVPFATTLSYLTNRFWYSLHKGIFKDGTIVPGTNVFTMAKIAFSQRVNEGLLSEYKKVKQQFDNGTITQEQANALIAGLKVDFLKPESVTKELVDEGFCFDIFNGEAIELAKAEQMLERQQHSEEISQKNKELSIKNKALVILLKEKNEQERDKYNKEIREYDDSKKDTVERKIHKRMIKQNSIVIGYILFFAVLIVFSYLSMEKLLSGFLLIFALMLPLAERFIRPFVNASICEAFKWVFSEDTRNKYEEQLRKEYEKDNPKPELSLSKIEDYIEE